MNPQKVVKDALKIRNLLEPFGSKFSKYSNSSDRFKIQCKWKSDMDSRTLKWAVKLIEQNLKNIYQHSRSGWNFEGIRRYMNEDWARYLVVINAYKRPVGYSMFRFDVDFGHSVLNW